MSACLFCGMDLDDPTHTAEVCAARQRPYSNPGKGTVLTNTTTANQLLALLKEQPYRTNRELNDLLGWQFSQAVFTLRRRGFKILTLHIGPRTYATQLVTKL